MRAWQFSKPKGPGYAISKVYYLSVLSADVALPTPLTVVQPKGEGGAVTGFIAPLNPNASKDSLQVPIVRGTYVVASKDRKTVLRLMMMRADESGVDPRRLASAAGIQFVPEWLFQITFESHAVEVVPAVEFLLELVNRLGLLVNGVIADPICQRYLDPSSVYVHPRPQGLIHAKEHVVVVPRAYAGGSSLITLGMQKFALPEFEVHLMPGLSEATVRAVLAEATQFCFSSKPVSEGSVHSFAGIKTQVRTGGFDPAWQGIPVWELELIG
jgi:hypothetical protein